MTRGGTGAVTDEIQGNLNVRDYSDAGAYGNVLIEGSLTVNGAINGAVKIIPSGDTTGAADWAAITAQIQATGSFPQLASGKFYVNQPIVFNVNYTGLGGVFGGSPSSHNISTDRGTVILPTASFTNPVYSSFATAVILVIDKLPGTAGAQATAHLRFNDFKIDCSNSPANVDGIATYGPCQGITLDRVTVYNATGNGIAQYSDSAASPQTPDQILMYGVMIEQATGHGYYGHFIDGTAVGSHFQDCTGDAFYNLGSNGHLLGCRFDTSANGYTHDVTVNAGYGLTGTVLSGCSSQRNKGAAVRAINSSTAGTDAREPVIVSGGHFAADGAAGAGTEGAFSASGRCELYISNAVVSVGTIDVAGGAPAYAIVTRSAGTGPGVPLAVCVDGGYLAGVTGIVNDAAPAATLLVSHRTATRVGTGNTSASYLPFTGQVNAKYLALTQAASAFGSLLSLTSTTSSPASSPIGYIAAASGDQVFGIRVSGDTTSRWRVKSDGQQIWGAGTTTDLNLYRASAGLLKTDNSMEVGTNLTVDGVLATQAASASVTHANSATTASTTLVMAGFGDTWVLTPGSSGKVHVTVTGGYNTSTGTAVGGTVGARFGTGTAPNAGDAVTGTRFGGASDPLIRPGVVGTTQTPFTFTAVLTLVKGTAYWFDVAFDTSNASDPAIILVPNFVAVEIQ